MISRFRLIKSLFTGFSVRNQPVNDLKMFLKFVSEIRYIIHYLALINRAGGLYGRILTEAVSTDQMQSRSVHTTEVKIFPYRLTKLG